MTVQLAPGVGLPITVQLAPGVGFAMTVQLAPGVGEQSILKVEWLVFGSSERMLSLL
jgi:hypothetical protein